MVFAAGLVLVAMAFIFSGAIAVLKSSSGSTKLGERSLVEQYEAASKSPTPATAQSPAPTTAQSPAPTTAQSPTPTTAQSPTRKPSPQTPSKVNLAPCYSFCASRPYSFCTVSHDAMPAEIAVWVELAISSRKLELEPPSDDPLAGTRSGEQARYCREWCLVGCANAALDNSSCTHVIEDQCVDMNTGDNRAYQCIIAGGAGCAIGAPPKRGEVSDTPNMTARSASGLSPAKCKARGTSFCLSRKSPSYDQASFDQDIESFSLKASKPSSTTSLKASRAALAPIPAPNELQATDAGGQLLSFLEPPALGSHIIDNSMPDRFDYEVGCQLGCGLGYLYGPRCPERCTLMCQLWATGPWQKYSCLAACTNGCTYSDWHFVNGSPAGGWVR
ncbi:hypothetical protein T492DRAFT_834321 [Pavlovales sp. CCMP2436]|nr:hypothetical protein T492DRAFT_834321 [Pavlovales sp. CCMP2436]